MRVGDLQVREKYIDIETELETIIYQRKADNFPELFMYIILLLNKAEFLFNIVV